MNISFKWMIIFLSFVFFQDAQAQLTLQGRFQYNSPSQVLSNLWSYTSPSGNKYALVGTENGFSIVDIQVPTAPVQLFDIVWNNSIWREVKTYRNHAYVTTEAGGGVMIVDLSGLPTAAPFNYFTDGGTLDAIHALHVDTANARMYLYGANGTSRGDGALVYSLADPAVPVFIGEYQTLGYIHDGEVRDNIMYASHIYDGIASIVDMTNPASPVLLGTVATPTNFTHNTWLNDASNVMFTTDENNNSFFGAYDISDPTDIQLIDKIQLPFIPDSGGIVHNVYVYNDFLVASYYTHGIVVIDAHEPDELVITEHYDTNSDYNGNTFNGVWGVCPYFADSTIVASDIEKGLFVFKCDYRRAAYLKGIVSDSITNLPIQNVVVTITSEGETRLTDIAGLYKIGLDDPGIRTITFSATGYSPKTLTANFSTGLVNILDVKLSPLVALTILGSVKEDSVETPINNASILVTNGTDVFNVNSDINGNFNFPNYTPGLYDITISSWGYVTQSVEDVLINSANTNFEFFLEKGYYDDFSTNFNWSISGGASTGDWVRAVPIGTINSGQVCNPNFDFSGDIGTECYVTQNESGSAGASDVDDGSVILTSPNIDLTTYSNPMISFYTWFCNTGGAGSTPNDSLIVSITNGTNEVVLFNSINEDPTESTWNYTKRNLNDFITKSATMRVKVRAVDAPLGHLVDAGFDFFRITDTTIVPNDTTSILESSLNSLEILPNPSVEFILIKGNFESQARAEFFDATGKLCKQLSLQSQSQSINIQDLSTGLYFVKVYDENKIYTGKFLKQE